MNSSVVLSERPPEEASSRCEAREKETLQTMGAKSLNFRPGVNKKKLLRNSTVSFGADGVRGGSMMRGQQ